VASDTRTGPVRSGRHDGASRTTYVRLPTSVIRIGTDISYQYSCDKNRSDKLCLYCKIQVLIFILIISLVDSLPAKYFIFFFRMASDTDTNNTPTKPLRRFNVVVVLLLLPYVLRPIWVQKINIISFVTVFLGI
jgi:hypothetical protein